MFLEWNDEIDTLKTHLAWPPREDDKVLLPYFEAAQDHVQRLLGFRVTDRFGGTGQQEIPASLRLAVWQLTGHFYENREASLVGVTAQDIPFSVRDVVREFRDYTYG